jgi:hypothetical protein
MRKAVLVVVIAGLVVACGAKPKPVEAPEKEVNSCEDALASVKKAPRKSEAPCMRVLKIRRQPPADETRVLVLGKLAAGPTLEDPGGGKEAKAIKVRKDGAFHDECPAGGAFVEVDGKLAGEAGLVEARIIRVLDDWQQSSCASDEGPPPPPPPPPPAAFDKAAAIAAVNAADAEMKTKCKTLGLPTAKCHMKITISPGGSVEALVDAPPFEGTKTAKCIQELFKTTVKIAPFSGQAVTMSRDFTL